MRARAFYVEPVADAVDGELMGDRCLGEVAGTGAAAQLRGGPVTQAQRGDALRGEAVDAGLRVVEIAGGQQVGGEVLDGEAVDVAGLAQADEAVARGLACVVGEDNAVQVAERLDASF